MVRQLWEKQDHQGTQSPTLETYREAANRFITSATAFMEQARRLAEAQRRLAKARDAYRLRQKELKLVRIRKEIDALKIAIPLLIEQIDTCQIEYASSDRVNGMACGRTALAVCSDCGASICSDCRFECCGDPFCSQCYDYHVANSCVKKSVQNESRPFRTLGSPPKQAS
jgi:hypothetical protein